MTLPIWKLNQFYESIEDNQINKDFKNLLQNLKIFKINIEEISIH